LQLGGGPYISEWQQQYLDARKKTTQVAIEAAAVSK
jgi:hypothetical protein